MITRAIARRPRARSVAERFAHAGCAALAATSAACASSAVPSGMRPMIAPVLGSSTSSDLDDVDATREPPMHWRSGAPAAPPPPKEGAKPEKKLVESPVFVPSPDE